LVVYWVSTGGGDVAETSDEAFERLVQAMGRLQEVWDRRADDPQAVQPAIDEMNDASSALAQARNEEDAEAGA
jgi:hypothetical protein